MIRGDKIYLRPVKQSDLALLETWNNNPHFIGDFNNFGLRSAGTLEKRFAEDGLIGARSGQLLVVAYNEEIVGEVSYHQERYGPDVTPIGDSDLIQETAMLPRCGRQSHRAEGDQRQP